MFCPKCGSQIADGARFCPVCGNVIDAAPAAPASGGHAAPAAESAPTGTAPAPGAAPGAAPSGFAQPAPFPAQPAPVPGMTAPAQHSISVKRIIPCAVAALALIFSLMPWFQSDQTATQLSGYASSAANFLSQLAGQNNDYSSQLSLNPEYNVWNLGDAGKVIASYQEMANQASDLASSLSDSYSDDSDDSDYYDSYDDDDYDSDYYYDYSAYTDAAAPVAQASASVSDSPYVQAGQVIPVTNPNAGRASSQGIMIFSTAITGLWAVGLLATLVGAVLYLVKGFKFILPVGCVFLVISAAVFEVIFAPAVSSFGSATVFPVLMALAAIAAAVLTFVLREDKSATPAFVAAPVNGVPVNGMPMNGSPVNGAPANGMAPGAAPMGAAPMNGDPMGSALMNGTPMDNAPVNGNPMNGGPANAAPTNGVASNGIPTDGNPP